MMYLIVGLFCDATKLFNNKILVLIRFCKGKKLSKLMNILQLCIESLILKDIVL